MKFSHLLTSTILLTSVSAFCANTQSNGTTWRQGEPLDTSYSPSYNLSGAIDVSPQDGYDIFASASFTYWMAQEDGLTLAYSGVANSTTGTPIEISATNTSVLFQSSGFKPGFKVGLGIVADHECVVQAEYTWYRGKNTTNSGTPSNADTFYVTGTGTGTGVWLAIPWFQQEELSGTLSSTWDVKLDIGDLTAAHPFYQGRHLVITPFAGLRAAWIRQSLTVALTESPFSLGGASSTIGSALTPQPIYSYNTSHSWAVGPRVGFHSDVLLPVGFKLEGRFAANLLYTRYTHVNHSEDPASTGVLPLSITMTDYGCLRPSAELGLGLGWGSYLSEGNFHLQFSADYDFSIFWAQNMMRALADNIYEAISASPGDLFLQGLTITARFDF